MRVRLVLIMGEEMEKIGGPGRRSDVAVVARSCARLARMQNRREHARATRGHRVADRNSCSVSTIESMAEGSAGCSEHRSKIQGERFRNDRSFFHDNRRKWSKKEGRNCFVVTFGKDCQT